MEDTIGNHVAHSKEHNVEQFKDDIFAKMKQS